MHAYRDQYAQIFNGGRDVVLIAISPDPLDVLASWARDDQFPFLMASDADNAVARAYGGIPEGRGTARNLFVIGPDGRIAYRGVPCRAVEPTSRSALGAALRAAP